MTLYPPIPPTFFAESIGAIKNRMIAKQKSSIISFYAMLKQKSFVMFIFQKSGCFFKFTICNKILVTWSMFKMGYKGITERHITISST